LTLINFSSLGYCSSLGHCSSLVHATITALAVLFSTARAETPAPAPRQALANAKMLRYAQRIVERYDRNGDKMLDAAEWHAMRGEPARADLNADGRITVEEFAQYVANYSAGRSFRLSSSPGAATAEAGTPAPGENPADAAAGTGGIAGARRSLKFFATLPPGTPAWFVERDADGDGQLTLAEFSPKLLKNEVDDFDRFDLNHDGVMTAAECLRGGRATGPAENAPQGNPPR
jgi:uncharacterized protein (DUF2141 family)